MTVLTQTSKMAPQAMNGIATNFAFSFRALVDFPEAIQAIISDTTGTNPDVQLIYNDGGVDGYSVNIDADGIGGSIDVNDARSADWVITIYREYDETQESNYADFNSFPAETVENDYDKLTMIDQQQTELLGRTISLPITVTGVSTVLPVPEAGAAIGWDPTATFLINNPPNLNQVSVDINASPDYIGATGADGVLRVGSNLSYVDGGDFVTLDTVQAIGTTSTPTFDSVTLTTSLILGGYTVDDILDEDTMVSDRVDALATQQSIKAYVDAQIGATNEFVELTDTPANYTGSGLQMVRVNGGEAGLEFFLISDTAAATVASGDLVMISDINDSNILKQVTAQSIADLGAGGGPVEILDEGGSLTAAVSSIDFVGAGVTATNVGSAVTVTIPGGGGGATLELDVTQANAFSVGEWIYHNGTNYVLADASTAATAESIGVVTAATGSDFTVQFGGRITGLSGLTAGQAHFLSETAGAITATAPTTVGAVSKPVLIADSTTTGFIFNMRGSEITDVDTRVNAFVDGDLTAGVLTLAHNLGTQYVQVQVFDNNDDLVQPDDITLTDANNLDIDLTSFGTLTGTWHSVIVSTGATDSSTATDLSLAGQVAEDLPYFDGTNWVATGGAERVYVGSLTRDCTIATGSVGYTGIGFKPIAIHMQLIDSSASTIMSVGYATAAAEMGIRTYDNVASDQWTGSSSSLVVKQQTGSILYTARIGSFDADGFTIDWTRTGAATGTIFCTYMVFR